MQCPGDVFAVRLSLMKCMLISRLSGLMLALMGLVILLGIVMACAVLSARLNFMVSLLILPGNCINRGIVILLSMFF